MTAEKKYQVYSVLVAIQIRLGKEEIPTVTKQKITLLACVPGKLKRRLVAIQSGSRDITEVVRTPCLSPSWPVSL